MTKKLVFRAIIEVLGKPKEHVEEAITKYIDQLKKDKDYKVKTVEFAEIKKHKDGDLWITFAELEAETSELIKLTDFCFDYMPSMIEVLEPEQITFTDNDLSLFLNDLQSKLHGVDMVAKMVKAENDNLKRNTSGLLKNYIIVLLRGSRASLTSEQLSGLTGVQKDKLEDYLDQLIDEGKVDLKGDLYSLK
ncbi:MAG TPA: hypothetical protein VJI15_06020 [Candidatus Nanoarchaeia archaeon]|nr:hypothetical protein [Candidatus Nanoarchaeia archaeon]